MSPLLLSLLLCPLYHHLSADDTDTANQVRMMLPSSTAEMVRIPWGEEERMNMVPTRQTRRFRSKGMGMADRGSYLRRYSYVTGYAWLCNYACYFFVLVYTIDFIQFLFQEN